MHGHKIQFSIRERAWYQKKEGETERGGFRRGSVDAWTLILVERRVVPRSERTGNNLKGFKDFYLKAKAGILP